MSKKLIRLTEQDLHRIVKESVNKILNEGVSFDETIKSIKDLCNDTNMTVEFGQKYVYDGIPTLPVKLTANNADKYDVEEILGYLENYSWVTPPMPKYDRNSYTLIVKGELMPSGANGI